MNRAFLPIAIVLTTFSLASTLASCGGGDSSKSSNAQVNGTTSGEQGPTGAQPGGSTGGQAQGTTAPRSRSKPSRKKNSRSAAGNNGGTGGSTGTTAQPNRQKKAKGNSSPAIRRSKRGEHRLTTEQQKRLVNKPQLRATQATACRALGAQFIAQNYGVSSTEPRALARAYARAFVKRAPAFPYKPIYQGCLEGLGGK